VEINLNIAEIVSQLKTEQSRLDQAIAVLEGISSNSAGKISGRTAVRTRRRRGLTAAGRRRLSELMKKRWAERRKKAASKG